ncbi:nucleotidyl transferase AbiEii/AbiGii toxin family protein [Ferruginibacter sp. HRS2-29]|uniref:nucleotidyl transferase AbiEii/AbiGii toxin family protein n=1 Tax=Ferruginibacter sp. HRS2-29 TaxID=2487334 RepID=UPI0020CC9E44|nr:nucleotidyl transferase AbiEii/AbiGii toxin family protein [Ferruginibacter sp. HRS2-29]MCP9751265.1 hypothetical protein [Ferruginibacter sp. HRS2-29]
MLQKNTVEPSTFALLEELMNCSELNNFLLVGGTALSLHYGHRLSIDLDLFTTDEFDHEELISFLSTRFEGFQLLSNNKIGVFGFINDIKVDFVLHGFPLLNSPENIEGVRIASIPDIAAMKVNAVLKRAVKKDFWDISELLQHYSIEDIIGFYQTKFPSQQLMISIPAALTYFDDAEESPDPVSLKGQTWVSVKQIIQQKVREFLA